MRTEPQSPAITLPRMHHATAISRRALLASLAGAGGAALVGGLGGTARAATARAGFTPEPAVAADIRNQFLHGYIQDSQPPLEVSRQSWDDTVEVTLSGAWRWAQRFGSEVTDGSIVLVSSVQSLRYVPDLVAYGTAKAGLVGLAGALTVALGDRGIRANAVLPATWSRCSAGLSRRVRPRFTGGSVSG